MVFLFLDELLEVMMYRIGLLALSLSLFMFSCKNEGCTDSDAENYIQKAKTDDGTCVYEANLVFWFDNNTKTIMTSSGVTSLHYYLDGTLVGTFSATNDFSSAPSCDNENAFSKSIAYDIESTKVLSYRVEDQTGNEHFSGTVTAVAKTCVPEQLIY